MVLLQSDLTRLSSSPNYKMALINSYVDNQILQVQQYRLHGKDDRQPADCSYTESSYKTTNTYKHHTEGTSAQTKTKEKSDIPQRSKRSPKIEESVKIPNSSNHGLNLLKIKSHHLYNPQLGIFNKGKSSAKGKIVKGVPEVVFSEREFLRKNKSGTRSRKNSECSDAVSSEHMNPKISRFFAATHNSLSESEESSKQSAKKCSSTYLPPQDNIYQQSGRVDQQPHRLHHQPHVFTAGEYEHQDKKDLVGEIENLLVECRNIPEIHLDNKGGTFDFDRIPTYSFAKSPPNTSYQPSISLPRHNQLTRLNTISSQLSESMLYPSSYSSIRQSRTHFWDWQLASISGYESDIYQPLDRSDGVETDRKEIQDFWKGQPKRWMRPKRE
ncbi:hypothetical protein BDB01DRAFT_782368 [Pilobolus umbonatus]|nr:hypothetical protein BDB01DRAFT_782368 [Pilobolus umbonatus]